MCASNPKQSLTLVLLSKDSRWHCEAKVSAGRKDSLFLSEKNFTTKKVIYHHTQTKQNHKFPNHPIKFLATFHCCPEQENPWVGSTTQGHACVQPLSQKTHRGLETQRPRKVCSSCTQTYGMAKTWWAWEGMEDIYWLFTSGQRGGPHNWVQNHNTKQTEATCWKGWWDEQHWWSVFQQLTWEQGLYAVHWLLYTKEILSRSEIRSIWSGLLPLHR